MRLSRFVAKSGLLSIRKAEQLILDGKIKVNDKTVRDLSYILLEEDKVYFKGKLLSPEKRLVIALNKPAGYISSVMDEKNRKTVIDLIPGIEQRVYPVGRLDFDSRGLIILTNDGDLANRIMHPRYGVHKKYDIRLDKRVSKEAIDRIRNCKVRVDNKNVDVRTIEVYRGGKKLSMTIAEGRKRIIRRLFEQLGFKVLDLKRIQIGALSLKGLKEGKYRILGDNEIKSLLGQGQATNG